MTLEQIRIFLTVAETLNMTQAARELHMTQSAVSAAISALETRHNILVFDRIGRGLNLSATGRIFLNEARALWAQAQQAARALDELAGLTRGTLTIAASQTVANYWLPRRLAYFASRYPDINITLTVGNTRNVAERVVEGMADIGFGEGEITHNSLIIRHIGGDHLSLYAAPHHPMIGKALTPQDLAQAHWIMRDTGSGTRATLETALDKIGIDLQRLSVLLELPSNEAVLAAVSNSNALTAVSEFAAAPHVAARTLCPLSFDLATRKFYSFCHKDRTASAALLAFLTSLDTTEYSSSSMTHVILKDVQG